MKIARSCTVYTLLFSIPVILLLLNSSCSEDIEKTDTVANPDSLPQIVMEGAEILFSDSAEVKMRLNAPTIIDNTREDSAYTEFPDGIKANFFNKQQESKSSIRADYAAYREETELWEYKGNVKLVNEQGDVLKTEHLFANRKEEKIYSEEYVSITSPDGTEINGAGGFESNLRFTEYRFTDVSGKINK